MNSNIRSIKFIGWINFFKRRVRSLISPKMTLLSIEKSCLVSSYFPSNYLTISTKRSELCSSDDGV